MTKIKTSELTDTALDWAVAQCEGYVVRLIKGQLETAWTDSGWRPSADWAQGGPLIDREKIDIEHTNRTPAVSFAKKLGDQDGCTRLEGPTSLIAAMRCFVASKLGDDVDVPDELQSMQSRKRHDT